MKLRGFFVGGALAFALALTACGGGGGDTGTGGDTGNGGGGATTINVGTDTGTALQFNPTTVQAPANTEVQLVFTNQAEGVPHNLAFQEGIDAKTPDQVAAGASATISFTTPGAGSYKFVCTLHPGMEGTLTVQ